MISVIPLWTCKSSLAEVAKPHNARVFDACIEKKTRVGLQGLGLAIRHKTRLTNQGRHGPMEETTQHG